MRSTACVSLVSALQLIKETRGASCVVEWEEDARCQCVSEIVQDDGCWGEGWW